MDAVRLRTEYLTDPIGLGIRKPRLMWNCRGGITQTAFEIEADIDGECFQSGRIPSSSMHYDLADPRIQSRTAVRWRVRLWDEKGEAGSWSEPAVFEMGLLDEKDWSASWICGSYRAKRRVHYPVDCFRKRFQAGRAAKARIYAAACGMYEILLNGIKITEDVLLPGATDHRKRLQVQTFDVTDLIQEGTNEITALLAGGWYKGYLCSDFLSAKYGNETKLCLQLEITEEKGEVTTVGTDESWEWSNNGPIRFADNKMGEVIDARMTPDYRGHARKTSHPVPKLPSDSVPIREHETFRPSLIITPSGRHVLDFGQNIAGFVDFTVQARAGEKIILHMGEMLREGEFTQDNIDPDRKHETPFQKVEYTCREGINHYRTKFAIFGFRYVLAEGDRIPAPENFTAIAVSSDLENTLRFDSDSPLLNAFVDAARWSAANNSADVPTDCPTRERTGWTGDAQIFAETASYLFDWAAFGRKYIRDISDAQRKNGSYTQCAPRCAMQPFMRVLDSSSGWADAGVIIPYVLWKQYGDERFLSAQYSSMAEYGEFLIRRLGRKALNLKRPDIPKELQKYLVMSGLSYGEWLEPKEAVPFDVHEIAVPHVEESTAYTFYVLCLLSEIASRLGKDTDAERYHTCAAGCMKAYRALVSTKDYSLDTDRQAKLVRPLFMGLLDDEMKTYAQKRLLKALDHFGWRIGTGFLSTPFILSVLQDIDVNYAYRLLENKEIPGWLAMPENGATTIWENWEGPLEENPQSLDHYSKGAVCAWIFSQMCGVQPDGENHFRIAPHPGGHFRRASVEYNSVYGTVKCAWKREEGAVKYTVSIPANTTAEVLLGGEWRMLTAGNYEFSSR